MGNVVCRAACAAWLLSSAPGWAATVTQTDGPTSSVVGITSTINFDGSTTTDLAGHTTYITPQFGNGLNLNGSQFLGLNDIATAILFDRPIEYFGLQWGSPDPSNTVQLYNGVSLLATITGVGIGSNNYVNLFASLGEEFTIVVLSSTGCCFESDNHSYGLVGSIQATPEPNLFVPIVLIAVGLLSWRRFGRWSSR
jgi:hypothetical protein